MYQQFLSDFVDCGRHAGILKVDLTMSTLFRQDVRLRFYLSNHAVQKWGHK